MNGNIRILLVEDSPTDVLLTEEALAASRFHIQSSHRLGDALKLLVAKNFDVILLDLGLPDSQGLETLRTVRGSNPKVAVVVLTGKDDEELAIQALKEGAQDYLVKGDLEPASLRRAIRYAVEREASERMLKQSEERIRELTAHIHQVLWTIDAQESKVLYVSPAYAGLWGRSTESLLENPQSYMEGIHPDDLERMRHEEARMYETGQIDVECRVLRPDGTIRWVWVRGYPVKDDGRIVRIVGVIEDITEKRRLADERDDLVSRLQLHIERLPLAYILFDADLRIIDWNPAAEKTFGYSKADVLGIGPPYEKIVPKSTWPVGASILQRLRSGDMQANSINENLTKDGRTIVCEWSNTPLMNEQGRMTGLISLAKDITLRQKRVEDLRLRDRAIHAITQGILITDPKQPDNPIIFASSSFLRMTGYTEMEVLGRNCRFLQGSETDRAVVARVRDAIRIVRPSKVELLNYRKDGTTFWNELSISPVFDDQGALTHFVGTQTDVTERRQLEEQLRQAQKMEAIGQLAGGVAHDFNNLLTIMSGYSEIILSKIPHDDPMREWVKAISVAGERAAALTRQLLAFSRKTVLEPRVLDLNDVVRDTEKFLRRLIGEDILLVSVLDPNISRVKVDPDQMGQVLMNLSVNARDAMPKGGNLTIETRNVELDQAYANRRADVTAGSYALLSISDSGTGMTPEVQSHIFEPFFTTKGVGKGTGLGLSVVLGIVKQSGGHVEVYSEVGVGTTFKVYLPALEDKPATSNSFEAVLVVKGTETILLVEDEDSVRALALFVLQNYGYTILPASNGKEALRIAEMHAAPIDLLVTDVVMPAMGGPELAESLKQWQPDLKVLYTSGYTDDAVVRHGILQEKVAFLQKPYTPLGLARKVRQVLVPIT